MRKKYAARKEFGFGLVFLLCPLVAWAIPLLHPGIFLFLFALTITAFFLWVWFGTYYLLDGEYFIWRSGPFRKRIPIREIAGVTKNVRSLSGMRPALTFEYLKIRYNTYDDVFIAPENEDGFIGELTGLRPEIAVSRGMPATENRRPRK